MDIQLNRRGFLATSALAAASMLSGDRLWAADPEYKTTLHKALIGLPLEETLKRWKAAGIAGMEARGPKAWRRSPAEAANDHLMAEKLGMRIHSVMFGWANLNAKDSGQVARDVENIATALRAAQGYGADTILLVPCQIKGMPIPKPWDFDIEFDQKTGHLKQVVAGDNAPYERYIKAHNHATDATRKAVEKLIPVAQETGVVIALENVWNNLWVKPALFAHFVASFDSHWVQAYYDVGNHVRYAPPEQWIRALGRMIAKIHIKDFRLDRKSKHGGSFVDVRDGSVNWPSVRAELQKIGYSGWVTLEGSSRLPLEEQSKRLDLIIAGK